MRTVALLVIALAAAACSKSVPSPWKERGVPAEWLVEVFRGTNADRFVGAYGVSSNSVLHDFQASLSQHGYVPCGSGFMDHGEATAFFKRDGELWQLTASPGSDRSVVHLEKSHASDADIARAGCR